MVKLSRRQIKVLKLRQSGIEFKNMKKYHICPSTAYDAYIRAKRNLNISIDTINFAVKGQWLSCKQIHQLKTILRKL